MKEIVNNIIPLKGFTALTLWPFIFVRRGERYTKQTARHEAIHATQQKEMLIILFLLWYGIEWLVKWAKYRNKVTAYKNISFEREAYDNQSNISYLDERRHYAWTKYIINN